MVNEQKHDQLLRITSIESGTLFAETKGAKLMMNLSEQKGISAVKLDVNATHKIGSQYVFESNKKDVLGFALSCRKLSRLVMVDIYDRLFDRL